MKVPTIKATIFIVIMFGSLGISMYTLLEILLWFEKTEFEITFILMWVAQFIALFLVNAFAFIKLFKH